MLSRLIIIISCISLVGVTVVPGSLIPCCCKAKGQHNCSMEKSAPRCSTGNMMCAMPVKAKSCCAKTPSKTCCPQKTIKPECPNCRCLEQLQILTLSGQNDNEHSIRISVFAAVQSAVAPLVGMEVPTDSGAVTISRGMPLSLQTCTLRC
jgi:hypothetical protein